MKYMAKKNALCFGCTLFYVYYVYTKYLPFSYLNIFAGVKYNGKIIFYAPTIFLFGIVIYSVFGNTEKYVGGYGILELARHKNRRAVIKKILLLQLRDVFMVTTLIVTEYVVISNLLNRDNNYLDIKTFIMGIVLFFLVAFSLVLWQSLFEILFDSRIAILLTMSIICFHICIGDMYMLVDKNKYVNMFFYSNLGLGLRNEELHIDNIIMLIFLISICIGQIILIEKVFKKKDIFSIK